MISRRDQLLEALKIMAPLIPKFDQLAVLDIVATSKGLAKASPQAAIWGALTSHVRHFYTDYDDLRDDGYDEEQALGLVLNDINQTLTDWGAKPIA